MLMLFAAAFPAAFVVFLVLYLTKSCPSVAALQGPVISDVVVNTESATTFSVTYSLANATGATIYLAATLGVPPGAVSSQSSNNLGGSGTIDLTGADPGSYTLLIVATGPGGLSVHEETIMIA